MNRIFSKFLRHRGCVASQFGALVELRLSENLRCVCKTKKNIIMMTISPEYCIDFDPIRIKFCILDVILITQPVHL